MKTVAIALGLLALLMVAEGSKIGDLVRKQVSEEESSSEEFDEGPFPVLNFIVKLSALIKEFTKNMAAIKSDMEVFGGLQGFEDYVLGDESALMYFLMVEGESEASAPPPTSDPYARSGNAKRSMKELLAQLEKLTNKK
ncbi:uncharacterized protein LOC117330888 [Pecten maximus]|uniref:uncharacterized protein LOC117330888 n=1 Tax=Pecten maximus TaxID=6579 RepID=UPI001458F591|nr:uncharacterized protein LOC117330888 [Pecten maximus]